QIDSRQPAMVAVLAAVVAGAAIGLWHGLLVTRFQIPAFIVTLSGFLAYRGLGLVLSGARGLSPMGSDFVALGGRLSWRTTVTLCVAGFAIGMLLLVRGEMRRREFKLPPAGMALLGLRAFAMVVVTAFLIVIYQEGMPVPVLIAALATA